MLQKTYFTRKIMLPERASCVSFSMPARHLYFSTSFCKWAILSMVCCRLDWYYNYLFHLNINVTWKSFLFEFLNAC